MARIHAFVKLDPQRYPEQLAFLQERVQQQDVHILREVAGQFWVSLEEGQVDTLVGQGMVVVPSPEADVVELQSLTFRPASDVLEPPEALRAPEPSEDTPIDYLVQFRAPTDKTWLQEIATIGGELLQAIPHQAAVFRFTRQEADAVRGLTYVSYVGPFHPAYAVSLDLAGAAEPFTASSLRNMQVTLPPDDPAGNLMIRFFDGINPEERRADLTAAGAIIVRGSNHGFVVRAPQAHAGDILRVPGIFAAELPHVASTDNFNGGVILGTNQVREVGTVNFLVNLDGLGEVVAQMDTGFDVGNLAGATPPHAPPGVTTAFHPDLVKNIRLRRNTGDIHNAAAVTPDDEFPGHGTHVAGTICGDGASSPAGMEQRGMAPAASLIAMAPIQDFDFVSPFDFAFAWGARVINNSWGRSVPFGVNNNRYLPSPALELDRWCFDHPDVLLVFTSGNTERDTAGVRDGKLDANTLRLTGAAKNVLTVGASENLRNNGGWADSYRAFFGPRYDHADFVPTAGGPTGTFQMSDNPSEVGLFSCRGIVRTATNARTNRIKPDVVAPGTNVLSLRSQGLAPPVAPFNWHSTLPGGLSTTLYHFLHGTSMAAPMVTGCAVLIRQYYRTRFAQLRRPILLEGIPIPAAPPLPAFSGLPSIAAHTDGLVFAWCSPALPAASKKIMATRLSRALAPVDAAPVELQANVGEHAPAPKIATRGERTYLLHRHGDNTMRLSCYDRSLHLEVSFGTNGVVTLAPNTRPDDNVLPDLLVVDEHVVCVFPAAGANGYFFQRFRADTGAPVDPFSSSFLFNDNTGPHSSLVHHGGRYTVAGVVHSGNYQLQVRQMDGTGKVVGSGPLSLADQGQEICEPCLLADSRMKRLVLAFCDARSAPGGEISLLFLDANAAPTGASKSVIAAPAGSHVRRPRLLMHPQAGYVLIWEEDSQGAHYDVYVAFLGDDGLIGGPVTILENPTDPLKRKLIRLSDTPDHTAGFAALADARGVALVFQSPDESNSDRAGVYALNLTPGGAFEAQEDPSTPLLKSGHFATVDMLSSDQPARKALSAEWAGGSYYLLRASRGTPENLEWVRLNADGVLDSSYAVNGIRTAPVAFVVTGCQLLWTETSLITVVNDPFAGITVHQHDAQGVPVVRFGAGGAAVLQDKLAIASHIPPQVGSIPTNSQVAVAYGSTQGGVVQLRYQRLDSRGVRVGNAVDLAQASGVASHGWFQFVASEGKAIAIYHRVTGAVTRVRCRRFNPDGTPSDAERDVSAATGEAINATIARRPTAVNSSNREYAAVWQYRANPAARWELRFSRLDREGKPMLNPPKVNVPPLRPTPPVPVADVAVVAAGPDWAAGSDAIEPQLICTYTHSPWPEALIAPPPSTALPGWSPSYGLAWIGESPDGSRVLFFTVLDENGRRAIVPQPPPATGLLDPPVAPRNLQISDTGSRVRNFKLVWNGRIFFLYWVEEAGGGLQHRCTAVNRHVNRIANNLPSAALLRATLVNGATNLNSTSLPDVTNGYGWGRVNLRQALAPAPPVTLHVRDDCAIGPGRTATYRFVLPAGTALLRVTLNWTDPPGPRIVNPLHLTVRAPAVGAAPRPEYRGNLWDSTPNRTHLSRPVANPPVPADNHENIHTFKQVVIETPPPGLYEVEVSAESFPADPFNQQNLQAFALVFAGTGPEVVFSQPVAAVQGTGVY